MTEPIHTRPPGRSLNNDEPTDEVSAPARTDTLVGYGRPPRQHRFRKGQSGNPSGRPKRKTTLADQVLQVTDRKVSVKDGTGVRQMNVIEATLLTLTQKALKGDFRCAKLLIELDASARAEVAGRAHSGRMGDEDAAILARYLRQAAELTGTAIDPEADVSGGVEPSLAPGGVPDKAGA